MDLGATRREAFQKLRERNDSKTLDNFVAAQLQAEELGTPLADALASIAADTRRMAAQTARRRAQRAAPRITLTAIALLLPATMILIGVGIYIGSGIHSAASSEARRSGSNRGRKGDHRRRVRLDRPPRARAVGVPRADPADHVAAAAAAQRTPAVGVLTILAAALSFIPLRYWERIGRFGLATPRLSGGGGADRNADPRGRRRPQPVLLLHARHRRPGWGGVRAPRCDSVLAAADGRLRVGGTRGMAERCTRCTTRRVSCSPRCCTRWRWSPGSPRGSWSSAACGPRSSCATGPRRSAPSASGCASRGSSTTRWQRPSRGWR